MKDNYGTEILFMSQFVSLCNYFTFIYIPRDVEKPGETRAVFILCFTGKKKQQKLVSVLKLDVSVQSD